MGRGTSSTGRVGDCSEELLVQRAGSLEVQSAGQAYLAGFPDRTHTFVIRSGTCSHRPHTFSLYIVIILVFVYLLWIQEPLHAPNPVVLT